MRGIKRLYGYFKENGIQAAAAKLYEHITFKNWAKEYVKRQAVNREELAEQRKRRFVRGVRFSVIVPLFNSRADFLEEAIRSVIAQSYQKWELILIDASPLDYKIAEEAAMKYVNADKRVKYRRFGANLGISGNTNQGVLASVGDYVVFLDHDDMLSPEALYRAAEVTQKEGADFLYSDEMSFEGKAENVISAAVKPDFSEYTLRGINYIGHMCVVKRSLFDSVGGLRSEFDGSQDYDLVLRLAEKAKKIWHLPYVLYYWRIHSGSVASGIEAKTYCLEKAKNAINERLKGLEIEAEISDVLEAPSAYRVDYSWNRNAKISLIVCFKGGKRRFLKYINDVLDVVFENNVEIIAVGGYNELDEVKVIPWEEEYSFCKMANLGAREASGELLAFLDYRYLPMEGFLEELGKICGFPDVGCVGGAVLGKFGRLEALGYALDPEEGLRASHRGMPEQGCGYLRRNKISHNVSCLSGGFIMVKRKDFMAVGGFNERMGVISGGADLCLKLANRGNIVLNPYARAKSGGIYEDFGEFITTYEEEISKGDKYIKAF